MSGLDIKGKCWWIEWQPKTNWKWNNESTKTCFGLKETTLLGLEPKT